MPSSGFAPNYGVAAMESQMSQAAAQNMQWAMANHARTQGVMDAAAAAASKGAAADWGALWQDQATRGTASLIQTGVYALQAGGLMGGSSPYDLFQGMQAATAGSQFGIVGLQGRLMGSGAITDDVTRDMFQSYQADFYSPSGAANQRMTAGFDDIQMGSLFQQLGQRGAFAGMQAGSYDRIGETELENRRAAALATDNFSELDKLKDFTADTPVFKLDDAAKSRISEYVSSAAQTLGVLRDIFGDRPMQELMQQAEQITGENFVAAGPDYIKGRLEQTRGMARAYGIDEGEMMKFNTRTTSAIDAVMGYKTGMAPGTFKPFAAAISPLADENALIAHSEQMRAADIARDRGEYMPVKSLEEIAALSGQGLANIALEETEVSEAGQAIELFGVSAETRSEVMAAMQRVGAAKTKEERDKARQDLSALTQDKFGITKGELQGSLLGTAGMLNTQSPEMREFIGRSVLSPSDQNRMSGNFDRIVSATNMVERSGVFTDQKDASAYLQNYMQSFNKETREDLITALKKGDTFEVSEIIKSHSQFLPDGVSADDFISKTMGGGKALASELEMMERLKPRYGPLANMTNREEVAASEKMQLVQSMRDNFYGNTGRGSMGIAEGIWQGLLGGQGVTNTEILDHMVAGPQGDKVMSIAINRDGSLNVDEAQAKAFAELAGDKKSYLMQRFGLKDDDYAGLAKAMGTVEGHAAVNKFITSSGMISDFDKEGRNLRVGGAEGSRAAQAVIAEMADKQMYQVVTGKEKLTAQEMEEIAGKGHSGDLVADQKKAAEWKQQIHENLINNVDKYLKDFENPESGRANALKAYAAGDAGVMEALQKRENELREQAKAGVAGKEEEADKIKELRNKVGAAGDGAAERNINLTGTLRVLGNGTVEIAGNGSQGGESLTG